MKKRLVIKIAALLSAASLLLLVGYAAGLHVQHDRECRFRAYYNIYESLKEHKELASGDYDTVYQRQLIERDLAKYVRYTHYGTGWGDFPRLLPGSSEEETAWQEKAIFAAERFHRERPDIALPADVKEELENFEPRSEKVRSMLVAYATHRPGH